MDISIIGKGDSIKEIDFSKINTKILSINYPPIPLKCNYICSYDFRPMPPEKGGIYVKDFNLQKEPCFNKEDQTTLGFLNYTVTAAVNWCYKQNFENIYLIGIDHDKDHFADPSVINFIEKFKNKCNIYQCHKSNLWSLPYCDKFKKNGPD